MKYFSLVVAGILLSVLSYGAAPITGTLSVCAGSGTALSDATGGGTWSSGATGIATINAATGVVTGIAAGTASITYTVNPLDHAYAVVTVNPNPTDITGIATVCTGLTIMLASTPAGGTWSSSVPAVATISATGLVTGVAAGNTAISYVLPTGCLASTTVTVNTTPSIFGTGIVCLGSPAALTSSPAGGTWASSNTARATANATTGIITGVSTGTVTITNTTPAGCTNTITLTVNPATPAITGSTVLCNGTAGTLADAGGGGTWSSANTAIATITPASGVLSAAAPGTATITYAISATGCYATTTVTVNGAMPISGSSSLCSGLTTTFTDVTAGGTWSSSNTAIATVSATGVVTGIAPGTAYISYTVACGPVVKAITITSSIPPISGIPGVCQGQTTTLGDAAGGGTWTSANTSVATVNSGTGLVNGLAPGTATIYYTIGTCGSANITVTVNTLPPAIGGPSVVCGGSTITLTDAIAGGTWTSASTVVATVAPATGVVTGMSAGGTTIIYTLPTGCSTSKFISVTANAIITGSAAVCGGGTSPLSATGGAGTWASSTPSVATVSATGVVAGVSLGTATISYTVTSTGCLATVIVTVTSACTGTPAAGSAHTTATSICSGYPVTLSLTGAVLACGISAQWQYSADGTAWTNLPGATTATYTFAPTITRYYRNKLTCISTGFSDFSVPVQVTTTYMVGAHTETTAPATTCSPVDFYVSACGVSSTFSVTTYFGDGTSASATLTPTGVSNAHLLHTYSLPGTYTIKHVLFNAGVATDSAIFTYEYAFCKTLTVQFYNDNNANCLFDAGDTYNVNPVRIEIDSNSVPIDTMTITAGLHRKVYGPTGTIYGFRYLAGAGGMSVACPSSGILYDTVVATVNNYPVRSFGLSCTGIPGYDLAVTSSIVAGAHSAHGNIIVTNSYCTAVSPVVTMTFSPDYVFTSSLPAPVSVTGTTVVWNLPPVSATMQGNITVYLDRPAALPALAPGDTINTTISAGPLTTDINPANNVVSRVDTVAATYAPSDIAVTPAGRILPCTELQYRVRFENTGFDTARNVYVLDTLAAQLDPASLNIIAASAAVKVTVLNDGVRNIARFDFPGINLLDSTHHGLCDGMVIFGIKARSTVADGTVISNRVGIVFDDFATLPTNQVSNTIGIGAIQGSGTVCTGTSTILWDETTGGTWSSTAATIGVTGGTIAGLTAGTAEITYTATNSCASRMTTTIITVNPTVIATVGIGVSTGDTTCSGVMPLYAALPVNGGAGATFDWKVNGVLAATGSTYSYAPADGDLVSVTLHADTACAMPPIVSDSVLMHVVDTALPAVTVAVSPGTASCSGLPVTFTATPTAGGDMPTYLWRVNGLPAATGPVFIYTPSDGDVINCKLLSSFMCRTADTVVSSTIVMTVDPLYIPVISITAHPGIIVATGQPDTLTANVTGAGPTPAYQWMVNGTDVPGATSAVFISTFTDYDSVSCRVTGSGVCAITTFSYVFITIHNAGIAQVTTVTQLSVFPNPTHGSFNVRGMLNTLKNEEVSLVITDMLGQTIYSKAITAKAGRIEEAITLDNNLANGMYMLSLRTATGNTVVHFVVEQ